MKTKRPRVMMAHPMPWWHGRGLAIATTIAVVVVIGLAGMSR